MLTIVLRCEPESLRMSFLWVVPWDFGTIFLVRICYKVGTTLLTEETGLTVTVLRQTEHWQCLRKDHLKYYLAGGGLLRALSGPSL